MKSVKYWQSSIFTSHKITEVEAYLWREILKLNLRENRYTYLISSNWKPENRSITFSGKANRLKNSQTEIESIPPTKRRFFDTSALRQPSCIIERITISMLSWWCESYKRKWMKYLSLRVTTKPKSELER